MEKLLERSKQNFSNLIIVKHPLPFSTYSLQIPATSKDIFQWKTLKGSACRKVIGPEMLSRLISRCSEFHLLKSRQKHWLDPGSEMGNQSNCKSGEWPRLSDWKWFRDTWSVRPGLNVERGLKDRLEVGRAGGPIQLSSAFLWSPWPVLR